MTSYATYMSPRKAKKEYPGWEPSDLQPHARIFQNEKEPEEYIGWEPSDLRPEARQFKPHKDLPQLLKSQRGKLLV